MFYGAGEIGSAGASLIIQRPNLFRRLPRRIQQGWSARAMRPAVAQWLKSRVHTIALRTEHFPVQSRVKGERLRVRLNDGTERLVDHVILGTGYHVNIALYPFLPPELLERIELRDGYPRLDAGFETSVPGLHFLGAPAAWSFGPLMRFVAGTEFVSLALRQRILQAKKCQLFSPHGRNEGFQSYVAQPFRAAWCGANSPALHAFETAPHVKNTKGRRLP
jgi:cation diffusion facilitator CzcD-associated flavoprotein CzcO